MPFVDITNFPAMIEYPQTTAEISGTNFNINGELGWTNDKHPEITNYFPQGFSTIISNLIVGANNITVFGENIYGQSTPEPPAGSNVVTIQRKTLIESQPDIATNALIFPSANAVLLAPLPTNIIWNLEKITDNIDGTNLTITKISVHCAETTNELEIITNNIPNLLGEISWIVPEYLIGYDTNYVIKFDVVDSSNLTNSRFFWNNKFTIIPEPHLIIGLLILFILKFRKK